MKGVVYAINSQLGTVAVLTDCDFSVFELLGDDQVGLGDEVNWSETTPLGSTLLTNTTRKTNFEVYFQNHWVSKNRLKRQFPIE
ncbi:MAG: hypothetical protein M0Z60_00040 [Nitrospiraceae bacterium]|nr:hypothetical protein [Nitrospiraceae bacterium]